MFAVAITLGTTLLFALVPAIDASRPDLVAALKENDRGGGRVRALSGAGRQRGGARGAAARRQPDCSSRRFAHMQRVRGPGSTTERVLTFWVRPPNARYAPADGPAIVERMLTRIEWVPGVESAAVNRGHAVHAAVRASIVFFPDRPVGARRRPGVGRHYVSADYFRTLGIPLRAGRGADARGSRGTARRSPSSTRPARAASGRARIRSASASGSAPRPVPSPIVRTRSRSSASSAT